MQPTPAEKTVGRKVTYGCGGVRDNCSRRVVPKEAPSRRGGRGECSGRQKESTYSILRAKTNGSSISKAGLE